MADGVIVEIERVPTTEYRGKITAVRGLLLQCSGVTSFLSIGDRCEIVQRASHDPIVCEVVGFEQESALLMPFSSSDGVRLGSAVRVLGANSSIYPDDSWLGRVVDAMGESADDKGPLTQGQEAYLLKASPPQANRRERVQGKVDLGIRAINTFLSMCRGQRMGIFAGSGVGKSIMMSMIAKYSSADVNVIGLIGERGREVQEFIEDNLGEEGMKRSVVVVATSADSALKRRQSAYVTMAIAEYFRDQGKEVLCMMDSVTRFAMAQREIGLSAGEPPTSKGYTPTVFTELPKLLERAGPGEPGQGAITGLFSVLVEGDDTNEPISDAVRGILDGHIMLDRKIAQRGRFPAINILHSVSRALPHCNTQEENDLLMQARALMTTYDDMAEMIRLGAYKKGSNEEVDRAIHFHPQFEDFLRQAIDEYSSLEQGYDALAHILQGG
ncbi:MAG: flagellar protein export ATPase FliI [Rickettsiales bacterium]|nr:flagellar protein export ATPase FliI [Rickettsiales bacterium]